MQQLLGDFIRALRQAGLPISPAETLDALKAAQLVGIDNSQLLKYSLATTLAKQLEHQRLYDDIFDRFFSTPLSNQQTEDTDSSHLTPNIPTIDPQPSNDHSNHAGVNPAPPTSWLAQQLLSDNTAALQVKIASEAVAAGAQNMRLFTQIPAISRNIMQALGDDELQQDLIAQDESSSLSLLLQQRRRFLQQQVRNHVEQQYLLFGQEELQRLRENRLTNLRLTNVDHQNYALMAKLVRKAAKQLASTNARRRRTSKRGLLDVKRTISANAAYEGSLFHTRWKSTRIQHPKVMVLCDVSGSVSRAARFLLLFVHCLQDVMPRVRSFVFCSDMEEVTDLFHTQDMEKALEVIIHEKANKPTDYGKALAAFETMALKDIDHRTTVIILGDARNNGGDGNISVWQDVYRRSRRVLWLNPEERFNWDTGDSIISQYRPFCSQLESCNSLKDLNRILGNVLKHNN